MNIDINVVLKKMQDRLGDCLYTIALLEAQVEQLEQEVRDLKPDPIEIEQGGVGGN